MAPADRIGYEIRLGTRLLKVRKSRGPQRLQFAYISLEILQSHGFSRNFKIWTESSRSAQGFQDFQ